MSCLKNAAICCTVGLCGSVPLNAGAAFVVPTEECYWRGGDGVYSDALHWNPGVPGPGEIAVFLTDASPAIEINIDPLTAGLRIAPGVTDGVVTFHLGPECGHGVFAVIGDVFVEPGVQSGLEIYGVDLEVGGQLRIDDGSTLGLLVDPNAPAPVCDMLLEVTGPMEVGAFADGFLDVAAGSEVRTFGSATLAVHAGSEAGVILDGVWNAGGGLTIGAAGEAMLEAGSPASRLTVSELDLGLSPGSKGMLELSDAAALEASRHIRIAVEGKAAMTVTGGAEAEVARTTIGDASDSLGEASILGVGSQWTVTGALEIGRAGRGVMTVYEDAVVMSGSAMLGVAPTGSADVIVEGNWSVANDLDVGGSTLGPGGPARLELRGDGALIDVGGRLSIWPEGEVELGGGELRAAILDHGLKGVFAFQGGRLVLGAFEGDLANASGTFVPNAPYGVTSIGGAYTQGSEGALEIELLGHRVGAFDALAVDGPVELDGRLLVVGPPVYTPGPTEFFTIITATDVEGCFANAEPVPFPAVLFPGGRMFVHYGATSVVLHGFQPCPTDVTGDGMTGFADLQQLLSVWGPCAGCLEDTDRDGAVGFVDLTQLLAAWGACPYVPSSNP